MSMQAKPHGAIHRALIDGLQCTFKLATTNSGTSFACFQNRTYRTGRWSVLRGGFRLAHAVGNTRNADLRALRRSGPLTQR